MYKFTNKSRLYLWSGKSMEIATMASKSITIRLFRKEKETRPNEHSQRYLGLLLTSKRLANRELKQRRRRRQWERQKAMGLDWQNNKFARASRFFVHFFAVSARLRRASCVPVEDGNTRQQLSFSFPELRYSGIELNSKKKLPIFDEME